MADKPKTYAQQVQELKDQKEELLTTIAELERQTSFIPELQEKISELNAQLAACADKERSSMVTDKAQMVDLVQRAESAENGIRNLTSANSALHLANEALQQQLDILGKERDKYRGQDDKLNLVAEELKSANLRVAAAQQQVRDQQVATNEAIAKMEKETIYLRQLTNAQKNLITALTSQIEALPYDALAELRKLAKSG